jgi:hypothetical protein
VNHAYALFLTLAAASPLLAQGPAADLLQGKLPADAAAQVRAIAAQASARALPATPLVQKALEGAAKGVAPARIVAAVQVLADQLSSAAGAIHDAGVAIPDSASVEAGAFALNAGLDARQVRTIARAAGLSGQRATALRVAGTLAALGVPPKQSVDLVTRSLASTADLNTLSGQVEAGMAHGQSAAAAAAGLGHGDRPATANPHHPVTPQGGSRKP